MNNIAILSDLYPLMYDELPGMDQYILNQHLMQACRKICDDTEGFIEKLSAINLVASQASYTLTPSWDCRIKRIDDVYMRSSNDVTAGLPGTLIEQRYYDFTKPDTLTLAENIKPRVAVTGGLVVHVILVPEVTQTGNNVLSKEFLNDYAEGIMSRAFYTLLKMPKQRWTDVARSGDYLRQYYDAVTSIKGDVQMNGKNDPCGFEG